MTNQVEIGAILKNRIRRRGFTQEEFAEKSGIGLSTLKKYMSGKAAYSIDLLETFSDLLDCSYDYLLGKSLTPKRDLHEMKETTRLTDKALEIISKQAIRYDRNKDCKRYIDTLSYIIESRDIVESLASYFYFKIDGDDRIKIGNLVLEKHNIEDAYLLALMRSLSWVKRHVK
jgi:transcriptional regulator with XRE-family HTH domain